MTLLQLVIILQTVLIINGQTVLNQLNQFQVIIKPNKCKFGMAEIEFLGHVIDKNSENYFHLELKKSWISPFQKCKSR